MKSSIRILTFLLCCLSPQAAQKFTRPEMIESVARNCITPAIRELAQKGAALREAATMLHDMPSTNHLEKARQSWINLQLSFKRNQMVRHGPVKDDTFWMLIFYPQALPVAVENVARSPRPITPEFIELLGSSAKGFYAIEYLLFDAPYGPGAMLGKTNGAPRLSGQLLLEGPASERRRLYLRELTRNLELNLQSAEKDAIAPEFPKRFSSMGNDGMNLIFNQVLDALESGILLPLHNYTNQIQIGLLRYEMIEGALSGASLSSLRASLEGILRYYEGRGAIGLGDYIRHVNPGVADRIAAQIHSLATALQKIDKPIPQALLNDAASIHHAINEGRKLEVLLKTEVVAALGVTVMFNVNDGD